MRKVKKRYQRPVTSQAARRNVRFENPDTITQYAMDYDRVSSKKQAGEEGDIGSLEKQQRTNTLFIDSMQHEGWKHIGSAVEKGEVGEEENRPVLNHVRDVARKGELHILTVMTQDRLARGLDTLLAIVKELEGHGVKIYSAQGRRRITANPDIPGYEETIYTALYSGRESSTIRSRRLSTTVQLATMGIWRGHRPGLGLKVQESGKKQKVVTDPLTCAITIELIKRVADLEDIGAILADFMRRGIKTPSWITKKDKQDGKATERGKRFFNWDHVATIISNPLYRGCTWISGEDFRRAKEKGIPMPVPVEILPDGRYLFRATHQPLVPDDLWNRAYKAFRGRPRVDRKPRKADTKGRFLLQGIIKCGCCGRTMTNITHGLGGYVCMNHGRPSRPDLPECKVKRVSAPVVEDAVLRLLARLASNDDPIRAMLDLQKARGAKTPLEEKRIIKLGRERDDLQKQRLNLLDAIATSKSPGAVGALNGKLDSVSDALRETLRQLDVLSGLAGECSTGGVNTRRELTATIEKVCGALQHEDRAKMKYLLRELFTAVVIHPRKNADGRRALQVTLNVRYPEMARKSDGTFAKLQMELSVDSNTRSYEIETPFREKRSLEAPAGCHGKKNGASTLHALEKLEMYSGLLLKMRACAIAKSVGKNKAHVSQIFSLRKIDQDLRERILAAGPSVREWFSLNELMRMTKMSPVRQEAAVSRVIKSEFAAAA